jgi:hypothetical protein
MPVSTSDEVPVGPGPHRDRTDPILPAGREGEIGRLIRKDRLQAERAPEGPHVAMEG